MEFLHAITLPWACMEFLHAITLPWEGRELSSGEGLITNKSEQNDFPYHPPRPLPRPTLPQAGRVLVGEALNTTGD